MCFTGSNWLTVFEVKYSQLITGDALASICITAVAMSHRTPEFPFLIFWLAKWCVYLVLGLSGKVRMGPPAIAQLSLSSSGKQIHLLQENCSYRVLTLGGNQQGQNSRYGKGGRQAAVGGYRYKDTCGKEASAYFSHNFCQEWLLFWNTPQYSSSELTPSLDTRHTECCLYSFENKV